LFDDVDVALTWHPASFTGVFSQSTLANIQAKFVFHGKASHAAHSPHLGRSALDAVELMNVGVNYLREHMPTNARVHYAITDSGGLSPNVVQARAEVLYLIRAAYNDEATDLYRRVQNVARGAAMMTDCKVDIVFDKACSNLLQNSTLNQVLHAKLLAEGPLTVDSGTQASAKAFQATLSSEDIDAVSRPLASVLRGKVPHVFESVAPYDENAQDILYGSTDVADVSWIAPTAQAWVACYAFGTPMHSWQLVSQGQSSLAHAGMVRAARVLTATAIELIGQPELITKAKAELLQRRLGKPYQCPIPADVPLPFLRS
jgi:aminobenzoyl-glutamate utilization protein B